MRIVLFADEGCHRDELFRYMHAWVASRHPDTVVVRVHRTRREGAIGRWRRKVRIVGLRRALVLMTGLPIQRRILARDAERTGAAIAKLPRPPLSSPGEHDHVVTSVNGPDTVRALQTLAPDVLVQAGAGILRPAVFGVPRLGAINMHHGIAPLIRGMTSLYWALHDRRPEWMGATIHRIDEGIDTGAVLAYAHVPMQRGMRYPELFAEVTEAGVEALLVVLDRLAGGDSAPVDAAEGPSEYRSTIDGWRLLMLELRRRYAHAGPAEDAR